MTATAITPTHVAALRAALTRDEEAYHRFISTAGFTDGSGFDNLTRTAFIMATRRIFPPGSLPEEIALFVGILRAQFAEQGTDLNAELCEQLILGALSGKPVADKFDVETKGVAQACMLLELTSDLGEDLDAFLTEVRAVANLWLS